MSTMTITLPTTFNVLVTKINESWDVPVHADSVRHLVENAVYRLIANSHASVKRENFKLESEWKAAVRAEALKIKVKIADGTVGKSSGGIKLSPAELELILKLRENPAVLDGAVEELKKMNADA